MEKPLHCPHCDKPIFRKSNSGTRLKARATILVLHKSGEVEFNCGSCKRGVILPTAFRSKMELRKAVFTIPKT